MNTQIQMRLMHFLREQKKTLAGAAIMAVLLGGFPQIVEASTWNPTLLVNTESFQIIDEGDSTTDIELKFGYTVDEKIYWDRQGDRFRISDDLQIDLNITPRTSSTPPLSYTLFCPCNHP